MSVRVIQERKLTFLLHKASIVPPAQHTFLLILFMHFVSTNLTMLKTFVVNASQTIQKARSPFTTNDLTIQICYPQVLTHRHSK